MPYTSSNKTHVGDSQVRNREVETVAATAIAASGPDTLGDGSKSTSFSPESDDNKATRFVKPF